MELPDRTYLIADNWGTCKRCEAYQDLRMGSCFSCSDRVGGKPIPGGHELWDMDNPSNRWTVKVN